MIPVHSRSPTAAAVGQQATRVQTMLPRRWPKVSSNEVAPEQILRVWCPAASAEQGEVEASVARCLRTPPDGA